MGRGARGAYRQVLAAFAPITTDNRRIVAQEWLAAGVWTRAFDAKEAQAAGRPITHLTQDEAQERLRRAGMH